MLLCGAEGGRAAKLHVHLETVVAQRIGERRELREALHPIRGPAQHVERLVARVEQRDPLLRCGRRGEGELDDAEHLLRSVRGERVAARFHREPDAHGSVAGRLRVAGQQRQAGR